jgi:ribosomal protein L37AE/L43A
VAIPESQLETWSHQGSIVQSSTTYATVRLALEAADTKYAAKNYKIFLQGSYGNDTNIYAESDVDIVIRLDDVYYHDVSALTAQELAVFNAGFVPATYSYTDYKTDVLAALIKSFGADVKSDKKAIKIKANGSRRNADVVVAAEFRRYHSGLFGPQYESGICLFTSDGTRIVNYPKQHSANCTTKHQATNGWYKPMVRILKNMRSRLVDGGAIKGGSAPSYFLEGLLYNVPNDRFGAGNCYGDTFVAAMQWILEAKRDKFVCANEQFYLVLDAAAECWPCANCGGFINAAVKMWNDWS